MVVKFLKIYAKSQPLIFYLYKMILIHSDTLEIAAEI